jgi:TonB-linked SusC/RagA family outer membrane protein
MKKTKSIIHTRWCILLLITCIPFLLSAQQGRSGVTGIVRSEITGKALTGVTVTVKNATNNFSAAAQTDTNGVFTFNQLPSATGYSFSFSYVGYEERTLSGYYLKPGGDFSFVVELKEHISNMDEVVVVGYGTMRKKDLTGSISQIKTAKLEKENPRSVQDLLRSGAAGLIVGQSNTAKGGGSIEVRGTRSLKAENSPLIVLDGVIFFGELSEINPLDIDQIDVLKDASAAAIYGAKSANGVIIITTKKGKTEKPEIRFAANTAWATLGANRHVYDAEGYLRYRTDLFNSGTRFTTPAKFVKPTEENLAKYGITLNDWRAYDALTGDPEDIWLQRIGLFDKERANYFNGQTYDWYDHTFQAGLQQNYTVSLSGKSRDNLNYYMSLGYLDNKGIIVGDKYRSYRSNFKIDAKINKWMSTGVNLIVQDRTDFGNTDDDNVPTTMVDWDGQILRNSPFALPYDSSGKLDPQPMGSPLNGGVNSAYGNQFKKLQRGVSVLNATLYQTIRLPFNITYQLNFSPRLQWFYYRYHESSQNPFWTDNGKAIRENAKRFDWQIDNIISWDYTFAQQHKVKVTLLQNAEEHKRWEEIITARDFSPTDALGFGNIGAANLQKTTITSNDERSTGDALMARLFYSYDNRYMLTASARRDGYSAFGRSNPRATFPSLAFAWNFGEEKFINWEPLSAGKLRLTWGQNGNRSIGIYQALSNLTTGAGKYPYVQSNGTVYELAQLYVDRMANYDLKWEATASWNVGLDVSFLKNRINATMDVYYMPTTDLLMDQNLPNFTGFDKVTTNLGEVLNRGFELTINSINMTRRNFEWSTSFGFFLNRNKIKHLYYTYEDVLDANGNVIGSKEVDDINNKWFIGHDIKSIWNYRVLGIWQENEKDGATRYGEIPGDVKVEDVNDDGKYTNEDKQFLGYETPRFRWTLRNDFTLFNNFDVSINIYSYWGHKYPTTEYLNNTGAGMERENTYIRKYWTPENPSNTYARLNSTNVQNISPVWAMEKSFIRLDNIAVSYQVPSRFISRLAMSQCRVYASIRNAAWWGPEWEYWDPETGGPTQPIPKTYSIGITASF